MNRRDFIKFGLSSLIFAGLPKNSLSQALPVLSIAEGKDHAAITINAINAVGGIERFVKKGDVVVVKPNIGWDRKPEYAANTNPIVVKTIVDACINVGAKKVKVFDNSCNDPRRCYQSSGINSALKGIKGVELKYMEDERYKNIRLNGVALKEWELYDEALSANVLINVPVAKHHSLTRLTLALKNMMGIMGGNRGYIHRNIEESLSDINKAVKSHLVIIDATRILLNHGPQGGSLSDVKVLDRVIASTDIVAADAYATTLFNLKPQDIPTTVTAYRRNLGEINLNKIKIIKT
ncbi:MAG TPA: DUF362 domain-containing protein [Syntrophorhabdaceae bacterium]|jgi:uncharacterized protein (DUF362 family)|nr:DUF362 domain-containing protein [Syntrophorhabdaceae bacterium]MDI9562544.1 DUF362 domain-containing protein [Pseudomonadota bacterium]OQC49401.1 MAG: hypothetical protein BWX58_00735 [Deltaproteobacteria bacterium ADurb.Bin026]MBP8699173.1 DUF362 domain-containing protein [Syntrophorhabdaceae bacterium]MBV6506133.1 hypothetical protein [Syntrophorhabdaceae bacterium]